MATTKRKQAAPWESLPADHLVWNPENALAPGINDGVSLPPPVAEELRVHGVDEHTHTHTHTHSSRQNWYG